MSPVVVFVGPPGAGKSTVAELVGDRLGVAVRDTDHDIEASEGVSIQDMFIDQGEAYFRALEEKAVATALAEHDGVVSLGGGAVLSPASRAALADHRVIFLDVGLASAVRRVGMNSGRPLLLGNVRTQLKNLLDQRRVLYRDVARFTIETDDLDAAQVADQAITLIEEDR
ncbi:shikimate kinase [Aeromicrobium panaciterrae]|uniref:shikimate kinase n=1 Tax=Aeromicrobium panaciterrae TaxID=363861 RepID=UPI0031E0965F